MSGLTIALDDAVLEQLAQRAADILEERAGEVAAPAGDEWIRTTVRIAEYLDCSPKRISNLISAGRFWPLKKDGSRVMARRSDLDKFVEEGGAKSP